MSRVDTPSEYLHGYRIERCVEGRRTSLWFGDRALGGRESAAMAARRLADATIDDDLTYFALRRALLPRANTPGEVPGVTRRWRNGVLVYWEARWFDTAGKRRSLAFSVRRHGERLAYQLALAKRLEETAGARRALVVLRERCLATSLKALRNQELDGPCHG